MNIGPRTRVEGGKGKASGKQPRTHEGKGRGSSWSTGKGRDHYSPPAWQTEAPWPSHAASSSKDNTWSSKGGRTRPSPNRRPDNTDEITPCEQCLCLLGSNTDCPSCYKSNHIAVLNTMQSFKDLRPFSQRILSRFACPLMHSDGSLCKATDGAFGTGDCAGCLAYRRWAVRYYGSAQTGHNPTTNVLLLGYERAILDSFDEDPEVFLKELQEYSHKLKKNCGYPTDVVDWFNSIIYPPKDDPLYDLPWPLECTKFKMPSQSYFLTPAPHFQCLGYSIEVCNVRESSMILTMFNEAYQYLPEHLIEEYGLPYLEEAPELKLKPSQFITLDLLPWASVVRQSFAYAFQSTGTPTMWSTYTIRELAHKVLYVDTEYLVDQFASIFLETIEYSSIFF